ncbi:MAG: ATP-binding protein [bacterium]|nr:ATP-binding protein [bacterium]
MDEEKIIERLRFHNDWWVTGRVAPVLTYSFRRDIYTKIISYLNLNRVVLLKGPRRTGKSTIFYQLIEELITKRGVDPKNILYLTFDDPMLRTDLFELLKLYEKISGQSLNQQPQKYIFLDEVHFLPDWAATVKIFYDKKLPLKIFGSGSSASLLIKQSENLGGRTIEETIFPLSFSEWKRYHGGTRSLFGQGEEMVFKNYLEHSGFMHLLNIPEKELWTKMLVEDIVTKAIYKDAVQIFGIREPAVLEKMFSYLAASTAGLVNVSKLSGMLGIERVQTTNYLTFLENSLLVFPLQKYSRQIRESLRSQEKIHLTDQGFGQVYSSPSGAILESVVARHLLEKYPRKTYFWREKYEVDLVIEEKDKLIPIEVKESSKVGERELIGLVEFTREFKQKEAKVIYFGKKRTEKYGNLVVDFIPAWEFLTS